MAKEMLIRIVSMLTKLGKRDYRVDEPLEPYGNFDYDNDHDHDYDNEKGYQQNGEGNANPAGRRAEPLQFTPQ